MWSLVLNNFNYFMQSLAGPDARLNEKETSAEQTSNDLIFCLLDASGLRTGNSRQPPRSNSSCSRVEIPPCFAGKNLLAVEI